jgi:hypothetical protein
MGIRAFLFDKIVSIGEKILGEVISPEAVLNAVRRYMVKHNKPGRKWG